MAFYSCLSCKVSLWREKIYCEHCFSLLLGGDSFLRQNTYSAKTYSLFRWEENQKGFHIKNLIYSLKGIGSPKRLYDLAFEFSQRRQKHGKLENFYIVPAPSKPKGGVDHAISWGLALSEIWNVPLLNVLERRDLSPQKSKTASDRKEIGFRLKDEPKKNLKCIFVDDVITTGATAKAAYKALEKPTDFEVWTIACRPLISLL